MAPLLPRRRSLSDSDACPKLPSAPAARP